MQRPQAQTLLFALVLLCTTSVAAARSNAKRTFAICNWDSDCGIPDIWSLMTCNSGACQKTCKSGCKSSSSGCTPTAPVQQCSSGQSWNPVTRSCIDIMSDPLNCNGFQNACPTDPLGLATCNQGTCSLQCHPQVLLGPSGACVPNAPSACGLQGKSCPNPLSNGVAICNAGTCSQTCNAGYTYSPATNDCVINNTPTSCGLAKIRCPAPTGTTATCVAGICGTQCNSGGIFNPLSNSCTPTALKCGVFPFQQTCPTVNNGQSVCNLLNCQTICNDGYVLSTSLSQAVLSIINLAPSSTTCVSVKNNDNLCGLSKQSCSTNKPNCISTCNNGACTLSGAPGFQYSSASDSCVSINDPINCGCAGYQCYAPLNGTPKCNSGSCTFTCNSGYVQSGMSCRQITASPVAKKKRSAPVEAFYCPTGETACPIAGSASLKNAKAASESKHSSLTFTSTKSGYECLDTQSTLESCGGCASLNEGVDCSRLPHASSMGCSEGKCVIFSCLPGYVANKSNSKCIRLSHRHSNATSSRQERHHHVHELGSF